MRKACSLLVKIAGLLLALTAPVMAQGVMSAAEPGSAASTSR